MMQHFFQGSILNLLFCLIHFIKLLFVSKRDQIHNFTKQFKTNFLSLIFLLILKIRNHLLFFNLTMSVSIRQQVSGSFFSSFLVISIIHIGLYIHPSRSNCTLGSNCFSKGVWSYITKVTYSHLWFFIWVSNPTPPPLWICACTASPWRKKHRTQTPTKHQ